MKQRNMCLPADHQSSVSTTWFQSAMSGQTGNWDLWQHGPMPGTKTACPMIIKMLLIGAYRFNSYDTHSVSPEKIGVLNAFLPLGLMVTLWLAACIPSLVSQTRSRIGTTMHIVFGILVALTYWILICVTISFASNVSILAGLTAGVHFAWFCAPSHTDTITGSVSISHCMRAALAILLYYTLIRSPSFPYVPDYMFIIPVWLPEIVNGLLDVSFAVSATAVLVYCESSRSVHCSHKDEKDD